VCLGCGQGEKTSDQLTPDQVSPSRINPDLGNQERINPEGKTIETRFIAPHGFERIQVSTDSFAGYLRALPLKPQGTEVKLYNGGVKPNVGIYDAVVDMDIDPENLQQCADAVMRLRGEYLWGQKRYNDIHFNFTNGFRVDYSKWVQGYRVAIQGNKTSWTHSASPSPPNSYKDFRQYMKLIFSYAGTLSLSKEISAVGYKDLQIGDIFIQGGSPGHAVIVVDVAAHKQSGEKVYLLAQSYMPAQEIQILKNPRNQALSPWYIVDEKVEFIETPEWTFNKTDLKRFPGD
jgi:hypothetical protein